MNRIVLIGSMTSTQKAKRALNAKGMHVHLTKTDNSTRGDGCAYGLEIGETDLLTACAILRASGIDYRIL